LNGFSPEGNGDLPDVLLEVHRRTGFLDAFTHVSERAASRSDLPTSLCAVLIATACNVGFAPLLTPDTPALSHDRLSYVQQHYVRSETLEAANARLLRCNVPRQRSVGPKMRRKSASSASSADKTPGGRTLHPPCQGANWKRHEG